MKYILAGRMIDLLGSGAAATAANNATDAIVIGDTNDAILWHEVEKVIRELDAA
jgi:hypothetical protein